MCVYIYIYTACIYCVYIHTHRYIYIINYMCYMCRYIHINIYTRYIYVCLFNMYIEYIWIYVNTHIHCYEEYLSPHPDSVMAFGGGAFGRWQGHEGGAFLSGISALIKDTPGSLWRSLPCEDIARRHSSTNQETDPCQTSNMPVLWLDVPVPRIERNKGLSIRPSSLWHSCFSNPDGYIFHILFTFFILTFYYMFKN